MAGVVRWKLQTLDGSDSYTFELNPNAMTSPFAAKVVDAATTTNGTVLLTQGPTKPQQWTATGDILTQSFYDALLTWSRKDERLYLFDHWGRKYTVLFLQFDPVPQRAIGKPWKHTYTLTFLTLEEPAT